jgi:membrane-bound serine protease (ClpP class)
MKTKIRRLKILSLLLYLLLIVAGLLPYSAGAQDEGVIYIMRVTGPVTPVMLSYIERGVALAEADSASALIMELDTPGGSVDITKQIIQGMLDSRVPIVVYVHPHGARAASAGTFITLAGHVAAMTPGTSIGAASPVTPEGQDLSETLKDKMVNILSADIEGLTKRRGEKAVEWARKAVSEAQAATAEQALELGVIDFVADDRDDLIEQIDGFTVEVHGAETTLRVADSPRRDLPMNAVEQFLHTITNPNIAFILMTLGINGLLFELSSPGGYLAGIVGGICLLLGLYALGVLSANYIGLLFIALSFILFIIDIKAPTHGALTIGGIISFIIGSLILFNTPYGRVSIALVIGVALLTGAFFAFAVAKVVMAQRRQPATGREGLVGLTAKARTRLAPEGTVFIEGERWEALADDGPIEKGQRVRITAVDGFRLRVRKLAD